MNRHTNPIESVGSGLRGARHGLRGRNFRLMLVCAIGALSFAYYLPLNTNERLIIILLVAVILAGELFNSSIEELADALIQEHHPGIAKVKELASGAMLILSLAAAIIGSIIFIPHL